MRNLQKKPRALRNIKKRTGAKAQGKQIAALSKQVSTITKQNFARIRTGWQRDNLTIEKVVAGNFAYICPLPYVLCDPLGSGGTQAPVPWTDNLAISTNPTFTKRLIFGYPDAAANSNEIHHTGGKLRYTFYNSEPSYTKQTLMLIRPKKKLADQLVKDRLFKEPGFTQPAGVSSKLEPDIDYVCHTGAGGSVNTSFGCEMNSKYWDVLYKRELAFSHPNGAGFSTNVNANNHHTKNNAFVATGSIRLPAGGIIKTASITSQTVGNKSASAMEMEYSDQTNENSVYLVSITNGGSGDNEVITGGFHVVDYYKAVV